MRGGLSGRRASFACMTQTWMDTIYSSIIHIARALTHLLWLLGDAAPINAAARARGRGDVSASVSSVLRDEAHRAAYGSHECGEHGHVCREIFRECDVVERAGAPTASHGRLLFGAKSS